MNKKFLAALLSATVLFAGCSSDNSTKENDKTESTDAVVATDKQSIEDNNQSQTNESKVIYTSFYPIYNLTKQIAGDKFDVQALRSLETEAHDWEPSAKDLASLNDAKLLIINGAGMEEWKDSVSESSNIEILDTTSGMELIKPEESDHDHDHDHEESSDHDHDHEESSDHDHDHEESSDHDHDHEESSDHNHDHEESDHDHDHEEGEENEHHHHHGEFDPHTWLSPSMGKEQARIISEKLKELDPDNADYYKTNYEKIEKELDEIISEYKEKFEKVENKKFVVPHEAFAYLCREFNLEQIALTGITSTQEPDAKTMQEVTDLAKENNIRTIFFEKGGSDKAATAIANEIGGEAKPLSTLEFASKEELDSEVTYQDLIKENLEAIYSSLEK